VSRHVIKVKFYDPLTLPNEGEFLGPASPGQITPIQDRIKSGIVNIFDR